MTVFRLVLILLTGEEHFFFIIIFGFVFLLDYFNHCVSKPCK